MYFMRWLGPSQTKHDRVAVSVHGVHGTSNVKTSGVKHATAARLVHRPARTQEHEQRQTTAENIAMTRRQPRQQLSKHDAGRRQQLRTAEAHGHTHTKKEHNLSTEHAVNVYFFPG